MLSAPAIQQVKSVKSILVNAQKKGKPRQYDARLDGIIVIERTDKLDDLDSILNGDIDTTPYQQLEIRLYQGNSNKSDSITIELDPGDQQPTSNQSGLNGIQTQPDLKSFMFAGLNGPEGIADVIKREVEQVNKDNLIAKLTTENESLQATNKKLKKKLSKYKEDAESGDKARLVGGIVGKALEGLATVPAVRNGPLGGIMTRIIGDAVEPSSSTTNMSLDDIQLPEHTSADLGAASKNSDDLSNFIYTQFSEDEAVMIAEILQAFSLNRPLLNEVHVYSTTPKPQPQA